MTSLSNKKKINNKMLIGVIPARGNSKRIKNKNIKNFFGKPIIAWSIIAAKKSNIFDKLIVSTDSSKIASIANKYGADTDFIRPEKLSHDFANVKEVMEHSIDFYKKKEINYVNSCLIYAANPFLNYKNLQKAYKIFIKKKSEYLLSITDFSYPIQRALKINKNDYLRMYDIANFKKRSQDLTKSFHDANQFAFAKSSMWKKKKNIFESKCSFFYIDNWNCHDIDTKSDWVHCEKLYKINEEN